jgi:hypothetical protein
MSLHILVRFSRMLVNKTFDLFSRRAENKKHEDAAAQSPVAASLKIEF